MLFHFINGFIKAKYFVESIDLQTNWLWELRMIEITCIVTKNVLII